MVTVCNPGVVNGNLTKKIIMPAKKKASKSTSDESVTCSNQGEGKYVIINTLRLLSVCIPLDGQLTGVFSSDFPLLCTQNELPVIAVRNIAGYFDTHTYLAVFYAIILCD